MTLPERTFASRLWTEITNLEGGVPDAAAAMGINTQAISDLIRGETPSPEDLNAMYTWLAQRVTLSSQEVEDYAELRRSTRRHSVVKVEQASTGGVPSKTSRQQNLPSRRQLIGGLAILTIAVVVAVLATVAIMKPKNTSSSVADPRPSATESRDGADRASPTAEPTATAEPQATPTASAVVPAVSATNSGYATFQDTITIPDVNANSAAPGTDYYKDLTVDPPQTVTNSTGDVEILANGPSENVTMQVSNGSGAIVGTWSASTTPNRQQCLESAEANGSPSVVINVGRTVCVETANGASVARLRLLSVSGYDSAEFDATVWYSPGTLNG